MEDPEAGQAAAADGRSKGVTRVASVARKHLVDGEWITVEEAAARLGITRQQLYSQMHHKGCGLQAAVNLVRENMVLHDQGRAGRYMVNGKWMTIRQAAEALGVSVISLKNWMRRHPHPDGTPGTLAEAVGAYKSGAVRRGGSRAKEHRVGRKTMTVAEASEMLGENRNKIWLRMSRRGESLAQVVRYYEERKRKRAERAILDILRGP